MRQVPTVKQDYLYFEELKTRWRDSDVYGHMNNAVFYEYADTIVNSWLINKGSLNVPLSKTVGLVVETRCTYFSEIKFPDLVTAGLKLNKLGNSSVHYEIGLFSNFEEKSFILRLIPSIFSIFSFSKGIIIFFLFFSSLIKI